MKKIGFNLEIDEFVDSTPMGNKTFRNIIGTYNLKAEKRIILACHYDSKILKELVFKLTFFPNYNFSEVFVGATDSALPCALILDIAKKLSPLLKKQENPPVTLQLVFFDGEESFENWTNTDSIYGSRHLAKKWSSSSGEKFIH